MRPTLRLKAGRVVLRSKTDLARYELHRAGPYFLEREHDTLLRASDELVSSQRPRAERRGRRGRRTSAR